MGAPIRLEEAAERWEKAMQGDLARRTIQSRMGDMRALVRTIGNLQVKSVNHGHVDEFFSVHSHWGGGTRNKIRLTLNAFFKWAIDRKMHNGPNPMTGRRRTESPRREFVHLSDEQMEEMLDLCEDPRDRILCALQYFLSLRTSEVLPIKWGDWDNDYIYVWRSKKGRPYQQKVWARGLLKKELHRWQIALCQWAGVVRPDKSWYIICQKKTGRAKKGFKREGYTPAIQLGLGGGYRVVKGALRSIGIEEEGVATHTMRRSGADRTARDGDAAGLHGVRLAKTQLNHESERQTEWYIDRNRERQQAEDFFLSVDKDMDDPEPEKPSADIIAFPKAKEA